MASFREKLSKNGKGLLDSRAANIAEMTKLEAMNVVSSYKTALLRLQNQIDTHSDLAVDNTHSLRPGSKDFDPKAWVDTEVDFQKRLRQATIEYKLVQKWYDAMFPASEEEIKDLNVEEED